MIVVWLGVFSLVCASVPAALFCINLVRYAPPPPVRDAEQVAVSVLIPARNEAPGIEEAVRAVLASTHPTFEVVVMDDASEDDTRSLVDQLAVEDPRVRLLAAPALAAGWNGKQHACWALAQAARFPVLCFVDADVRLAPDCLARMQAFLLRGRSSLVSGFPQQITETGLEWLLLPLIHFVLLGFLPLGRMRQGTDPAFSAGCGQFMMVRREDYFAAGGHLKIRQTMHDGLRLPKLLREYGFRTDLADLTALARCRMYANAEQVWSGLAKNATEGLGDPKRIGPVSLILLLGQIVPFVALPVLLLKGSYGWTFWLFLLAMIAAWIPRWLAVARFRQDWRGALLHPFGIAMLLAVQWYALARKLRGGSVSWRNRAYAGGA